MVRREHADETRRRLLQAAGGGALVLPLIGIGGCSSSEPPAPAATPAPTAAGSAGDLPRLEESNSLAQALGYRHDGAQVDTRKFPRYAAGMACRNCIQFKGAPGDAWGACGIFPGKLVNAAGWCNTYLRKA